ncbi:hypothetical protein J4Q44_G00089610 [Coregonus suidteri]|uniref:Uncharacterized protein n=1 Tax=Coregonus suidteri TaxID=861788 RepID=A0AAN8M1G3_9TELE
MGWSQFNLLENVALRRVATQSSLVTYVWITNSDANPDDLGCAEIRIDVLSSPKSDQERPKMSSVIRWRVTTSLW